MPHIGLIKRNGKKGDDPCLKEKEHTVQKEDDPQRKIKRNACRET